MKPIRLNTIGKIVWFFLIIILILITFFVISLFKKDKQKPVEPEKPVDSEKIIDYTTSKNYTYDFTNVNKDLTIKESATYKLIGTDENYKIIVDSKDSIVKLTLANFNTNIIDNLIVVKNAHKLIVELEDGTENSIGEEVSSLDITPTIIKSEADIDFIGSGTLKINAEGNFIESKKSVSLKNVTLELNNVKNGFKIDGDLTINSGNLYIKANNEAVNSKGNVTIEDGLLVIRADKSIINEGLFIINKGKVFVASINEIKKPNANSLQKTLMLNFKEATKKMLFVNDTNSFTLVYAGEVEYQHVLYSDNFEAKEYILYETGKIAGTQTYGLYKIDEAEAGKQLICGDLTRFAVDDIVNVYDDIVKK